MLKPSQDITLEAQDAHLSLFGGDTFDHLVKVSSFFTISLLYFPHIFNKQFVGDTKRVCQYSASHSKFPPKF